MGGAEGSILTLAENVVAFLQGNNTAAADDYLSNGLTRALLDGNIIVGKPEFGQILPAFPCVFVKVSTYDDEIAALGTNAKKHIDYGLEIYPCTNLINTSDRSEPMKESYRLTDNILGLIRAKEDLSMAGHWVEGVNVSLDEEVEDGTNVYMNKITLQSKELAL